MYWYLIFIQSVEPSGVAACESEYPWHPEYQFSSPETKLELEKINREYYNVDSGVASQGVLDRNGPNPIGGYFDKREKIFVPHRLGVYFKPLQLIRRLAPSLLEHPEFNKLPPAVLEHYLQNYSDPSAFEEV